MRPWISIVAIAGLLARARAGNAQQVFVVDHSLSPGAFSSQIQPAIDAASSGDVVLVKGDAVFEGFTIAGKGLSVLRHPSESSSFQVFGRVSVAGTPASQTVR